MCISRLSVAHRSIGDTIFIMPHATTGEDRLAALEKEVATLRYGLARQGRKADWLAQVAGSMQDESDFDTVLELGRQAREANRPAEDIPFQRRLP